MFTFGQWIILGLIALTCLVIVFMVGCSSESLKCAIVAFIVCTILIILIGFGINWWNKSTASGIRNYKDYQSELENGIEREITITAEDGREIFHYEGKVDVESNHDDNYIKFEGENGKRYVIYYGVQDTIKIIEK